MSSKDPTAGVKTHCAMVVAKGTCTVPIEKIINLEGRMRKHPLQMKSFTYAAAK
ncbi:hypothetical protein TWF730_006939 [Orbilia blumenaviensis]|uniref:Uncharacterized protein n=1 Tax=Orbilia blumenaviensis TaxID=1796055 RepID=A0AAV9VJ66_9PEZI